MNQEIEKLIDLAIIDGQVTEKEKNVIVKKAAELGIDVDEVEMILEAKLHQLEASKPKLKEKVGNLKVCPACGGTIKAMQVNCSECGHELSNIGSNTTISQLLSEIRSIKKMSGESDYHFDQRKAEIINHTPIPISREDLLEFLSVCCSQADVDFSARGSGLVPSAWANKGNEALLKAKIAFSEDSKTVNILSDFEKKLKKANTKAKLIWLILGVISLIYAIVWFVSK